MDAVTATLRKAQDAAAARPVTTLLVTNAITASYFLWHISGGRPLKYIYKVLGTAVLRAVPTSLINAELEKTNAAVESDVLGKKFDDDTAYTELPATGLDKDALFKLIDRYGEIDEKCWNTGRLSGSIYHGGAELSSIMTHAFSRFSLSNPLHPTQFPSLRKMDAEIVSMTLHLFHGQPGRGVGCTTSGGSESILLAMKAYRDYAAATRGITEPELIVTSTAHAAFDKACQYFRIKKVEIPVGADFRADVAATRRAINSNTIGIVASAPNFPTGTVDPITELGRLALERGVPLHVDCCLGSFLIACAADAGFDDVEPFDFRVPGVTSISADTHKYGYAPKGSSVIMYSDEKYRRAQYFHCPEWSGGVYASPGITGSRAGALLAACWATLMHVGKAGYVDAARKIISAARDVKRAVIATGELRLLGDPKLSVVAFGARPGSSVNVYAVMDAMKASGGWDLNGIADGGVHLCITMANVGNAARFAADLDAAVKDVLRNPGKFVGSAKLYGTIASVPDPAFIVESAATFLDSLFVPVGRGAPPSKYAAIKH